MNCCVYIVALIDDIIQIILLIEHTCNLKPFESKEKLSTYSSGSVLSIQSEMVSPELFISIHYK